MSCMEAWMVCFALGCVALGLLVAFEEWRMK